MVKGLCATNRAATAPLAREGGLPVGAGGHDPLVLFLAGYMNYRASNDWRAT